MKANRANARRSSGPESTTGKRKVAQNARRHGLTTPPPWGEVTRWYRIIIGDVSVQPDLASRDPFKQAALRLAEAEARLERVAKAERNHLLEMHERAGQMARGMSRVERIVARFEGKELDYNDYDVLLMLAENFKAHPFHSGAARIMARSSPTRPAAMRRTLKTLKRYRRDAESARRTALKAWIKAQY